MLNKLSERNSRKEYVNNFLSSDEFRNLFYISNKISLEYMSKGNIMDYLHLFQDGSIDEEFLNKEIENNYIEGNYNLLLELYDYIIQCNYVNLTNTTFALLAAIKLKNKKARQKILKEAKKKKLNMNLFLMFILKIQIYLQKNKKENFIKNKLNKGKRLFLFDKMINKRKLYDSKFKQEQKYVRFLKEEIEKAIEDNRFEKALDLCSKISFYSCNNIDLNKYNQTISDKILDKIEKINREEYMQNHSNILKSSIVLYNDKQVINEAIKISGFLNDYNIVLKCQNLLKIIMQNSIFCKPTTIGKATYLINKNKSNNLFKGNLKVLNC